MKYFSDHRRGFAGIIGRCLAFWRQVAPIQALLLATMVSGLTGAGLMMRSKDAAMRRELMMQAQLLSSAIPGNLVRSLSGTGEDLARPEYQRLKKIGASGNFVGRLPECPR